MNQVKIAHTPQILLGVLLVGCLFYSQSLVAIYARYPFGAADIVGGGILSGGLHALSGPDHLAALLPFILGQKWINASHYGLFWGFGHGLTTSMMGVFGFYVKDSLLANKLIPQLTNLADYAVGVTLILIGMMGVYESWQTNLVEKIADSDIVVVESCTVTTVETESAVPKATSNSLSVLMTIFANGCFLGMSWDGIPSLAPTLSLYSWQMLFAFLLSYCIGTVFTIGVASGFIGESTKWLSTVTSEDLPRKLALIRWISSHSENKSIQKNLCHAMLCHVMPCHDVMCYDVLVTVSVVCFHVLI